MRLAAWPAFRASAHRLRRFGGMEVDGAPEVAPAEAAPSQTLYVHNLAERPRKDGAFCSFAVTTLTLDWLSGCR